MKFHLNKYSLILIFISLFIIFSSSATAVIFTANNNNLYQYSPATNSTSLIHTFTDNINDISVSNDDKKIILYTGTSFNNDVYISDNYGVSFSHYSIDSSSSITALKITGDGTKIFADIFINDSGTYMLYSYSFSFTGFPTVIDGVYMNFNTTNVLNTQRTYKIAVSYTGEYVLNSIVYFGETYKSSDYGQTYTSALSDGAGTSGSNQYICVSPSGLYQYITADALSPAGQGIHRSVNYGSSFSLTVISNSVADNVPYMCDDSGKSNIYYRNPGVNTYDYVNLIVNANVNYTGCSGTSSLCYNYYRASSVSAINKSKMTVMTSQTPATNQIIYNFPFDVTTDYVYTSSQTFEPVFETVPENDSFTVTLDTINAVKQLDGTWYTYPYGVPLQSIAIVKVTSPTLGYIAINCNFNNTDYFSDKFEYSDNNISANGWTDGCKNYYQLGSYRSDYFKSLYINGTYSCGTLSKPIGAMQENTGYTMTFNTLPLTDGKIEYYMSDMPYGTTKIVNVIFDYDSSNNTLCVYKNTTIFGNIIDCIVYNSSVNGDITVTFDINNLKATYTVAFNTLTTDTIHSQNIKMLSGSESNPKIIGYFGINAENTFTGWLDNLNITSHGYFPSFLRYNTTEFSDNAYHQGCVYGNTYNIPITIRAYYQSENVSVWNNYKDIHIIPRTQQQQLTDGNFTGEFDQNQQNFIDSLFGTGLSTGEKLFDVLMWIVVASLLMIIFGFSFGMGATMVGGLVTVVDLIVLIFFAYIGFIPVWIIILIGIFAAGMVAMFLKKGIQ